MVDYVCHILNIYANFLLFFTNFFLIRLPFPELHDLKFLQTDISYITFLKQKIKQSSDFPFIESCYKNGTITFSKEKS